MSRSGYADDYDDEGSAALYRGVVASAMRGKRGQAFLRDLGEALDAMPEKRLIAGDLVRSEPPCDLVRWLFAPAPDDLIRHWAGGMTRSRRGAVGLAWRHDFGVCAIGSLGQRRGVDLTKVDPADAETVGSIFDIAQQLAREVVYENDEGDDCETPEARWARMRRWVASNIKEPTA